MLATRALCRVLGLGLLVSVGMVGCERSPAPLEGEGAQENGVSMGTIDPAVDPDAAPRQVERSRMVEEQVETRGIRDRMVSEAMREVPRHEFVPAPVRPRAYQDAPLPIGGGRTVMQPYLVALMLELLEVSPDDRVLEVGTGGGYQAAVLAAMGAKVSSMERDCEMAARASDDLVRAGYRGVEVRCGDGIKGWPEESAFEAIVVNEAVVEVPPPLVDQLVPGGRMVVAIGEGEEQALTVVQKDEGGEVSMRDVELVRFEQRAPGE